MVVVAVLTMFVRTMFMIGVFAIPVTMLVAVLVSVMGVTRS